MAEMKMNPVTLDIVKDSLIAISNEVFYAFVRYWNGDAGLL